jgi:elongation factor G
VTDFLPAERARGITIQSAAITLHWPPIGHGSTPKSSEAFQRSRVSHTINLIDTPGHADFTFEVLRSLRILDGAVCVLDGVAGVEAQTEKVWMQANEYSIPRIVFVNKLDREGAQFARTVKEIGSRLRGWPAVCQIPWWAGGQGRFIGVGDAIDLCGLKWEEGDGKAIKKFEMKDLEVTEREFAKEIQKARTALVEILCEFDEKLLNTWLECDDDSLAIPPQDIRDSLRRCIIDGSGRLVPVFAGAAFKNIGVQPLLDAVDDLFPDPTERPDPEITIGGVKGTMSDLFSGEMKMVDPLSHKEAKKMHASMALVNKIDACALAFKVVNDPKRGILVYVRVYSGELKRNSAIWNTNLHVTERAGRLLRMYANDAEEIETIPAGQIGVIPGLKFARTGDTIISYQGANPKTGPPAPLNTLQLRPIEVPPPVFFAAIEPYSLSEEKNVEQILSLLLREDPSLHVSIDNESGQMLLSGMGELHLEIARDRLVNDFKAKASMGSIEISYRECVLSTSTPAHFLFDRDIAGKKGKAGCSASVSPISEPESYDPLTTFERDGNYISIDIDTSDPSDPLNIIPLPSELHIQDVRDALTIGVQGALASGPRRGFPLQNSHVTLTFSTTRDLYPDTHASALSAAARGAVSNALRSAFADNTIGLLEPVMSVVISTPANSLGNIVHDLSSARGGHVLSLGEDDNVDAGTANDGIIDVKRIYTPPDPFGAQGSSGSDDSAPGAQRSIRAVVPLKEMVGYLRHLRSLTGGRGTFVMSFERFERVVGAREKAV